MTMHSCKSPQGHAWAYPWFLCFISSWCSGANTNSRRAGPCSNTIRDAGMHMKSLPDNSPSAFLTRELSQKFKVVKKLEWKMWCIFGGKMSVNFPQVCHQNFTTFFTARNILSPGTHSGASSPKSFLMQLLCKSFARRHEARDTHPTSYKNNSARLFDVTQDEITTTNHPLKIDEMYSKSSQWHLSKGLMQRYSATPTASPKTQTRLHQIKARLLQEHQEQPLSSINTTWKSQKEQKRAHIWMQFQMILLPSDLPLTCSLPAPFATITVL